MDEYAQLKMFLHDLLLQVYMYAFMYVHPAKFPVEDHFPATKNCFELQENVNYRNSRKILAYV